jgi:hypothetical protein
MKNGGDIFILDPLFSRRQKNEYFGGHNPERTFHNEIWQQSGAQFVKVGIPIPNSYETS